MCYYGWSLVSNKRWITLETAKDLKTVFFLLNLTTSWPILVFKMFFILTICSQKFLSCSRFLLHKKWAPSIFTVSQLRLTHFILQSATWTPFRTPIPVISHFILLVFKPDKFEKVFNSLINSIIDFHFWEKK